LESVCIVLPAGLAIKILVGVTSDKERPIPTITHTVDPFMLSPKFRSDSVCRRKF